MKRKTLPPQTAFASIDDLLYEILLRLPLRPLARFKSVSKHWNSLISDPIFYSALALKPNPTTGIIFQSQVISTCSTPSLYATTHVASYDKSTNNKNQLTGLWPRGVAALNSCNGLLLGGPDDTLERNYYVCNPTTKKHFRVPKLGGDPNDVEAMCLAFDPSKSLHYNVVCAWSLGPKSKIADSVYGIEVFSSETGCWRKCGKPFVAACVDFKRGVYWNGAIHWIGYAGESIYFDPTDRRTPAPKVMPTPPLGNSSFWSHRFEYFGESGGHLHFIDYGLPTDAEFSVHELRMDYSEWFVRYKVDNLAINVECNIAIPYLHMLEGKFSIWALVRGAKDEDSFLVFLVKRSLVKYNLVYKTFETICEFEGEQFESHYLLSAGQYIESLCSV